MVAAAVAVILRLLVVVAVGVGARFLEALFETHVQEFDHE
jgi:hypothetical protein